MDAGPLPQIAVRGVGKVALPIDAEQAEDLAFAGMPAPYGKGFNTELDPNVRKATQLDPGRVRFSADWDATLRRITVGAHVHPRSTALSPTCCASMPVECNFPKQIKHSVIPCWALQAWQLRWVYRAAAQA